jgi:chromosome segregation ATPase
LVATINFIYTELFYAKWKELHRTKDLNARITELEQVVDTKTTELMTTQYRFTKTNQEVEELVGYVAELEAFKKKEVDRLTCSHCAKVFTTIYHLNSHRNNCEKNKNQEQKEPVY